MSSSPSSASASAAQSTLGIRCKGIVDCKAFDSTIEILTKHIDVELEDPSSDAAAAIWAATDLADLNRSKSTRKLSLAKHLVSLKGESPISFEPGMKLAKVLDQEISPEKAQILFSKVAKSPGEPMNDHFMASTLLLAVWSALKEVTKSGDEVVWNPIEDMQEYDFEGTPGTVVHALITFLPTIVKQIEALKEAAKAAPRNPRLTVWETFLSSLESTIC